MLNRTIERSSDEIMKYMLMWISIQIVGIGFILTSYGEAGTFGLLLIILGAIMNISIITRGKNDK